MLECLNLNDPKISYLVSKVGYNTLSDIINYNGIEILDIIEQHQEFSDLKNELAKSYEYQLKNKKFNNSIDDMIEISFWRMFTPSFYNWFGDWMIQYKLQNGISLNENESELLTTKYGGSYDNLKNDISKVVTEDGLPKLVYHGSLYDFPSFKNRDYIHFGTFKAAEDRVENMIGRLPFTGDNQFSSILEEQLSNISPQPNAVPGVIIKPYFLNIKKVVMSEDVIAGWTGKVWLNELNSGIEYINKLEDKGSISYAIRDINQTKAVILPSEDMSALLVENLVEELKVTPEQAKQLIPSKFLNPTDSKVIYFQKLNDNTYGFVTPNGEVFIDKSTQSLNTPFHEFYHIYDKIILSNYDFDPKAKSIIDRLNELVIQAGYLDKVKKMTAYKDKAEIEQLAEARAMLIGDAAESKILDAEHSWLMKFKLLLKDLVDYILDLIGTKSFKDYSPEEILNMTMDKFTNVMTRDMLYDRSFNKNITNLQNNEISVERKKQIEELFESNPELAESVYETLGFTTLSENEVFIKEIRDNRWLITANNKTWKNIAQGRVENMSSLSDDSSEINRLIKSIKENGYDITQENKAGSVILGARYKNNFLDLKDGKHRAVALGILFPNNLRTIQFTGSRVIGNKDYKINELEDSLEVFKGINIKLQQVTVKQITPQQKQQAIQVYSSYLDTIFPDSKVTEIDNSLYTSVINQLVQENKLEKDCTGGSKLKAEDGIATLFEKGGKWEIVTDFKNAPTHKSGGKDIYIQGKKVEVEKNELRIENDFGDVAVIPSKYRVEVEDAIKFNCYSCIDGIVEELPKMKDYAGDGTVFPFFGRYKRFKNSLPNNLKNTPEYDYAMRYYWKHNNKPKSFDESINRERPMFTMEDDGYYHAPSVEPNTLRFLKPKNHPTLQYELDWYNSDNPDAVDFRSKYNLDTSDKFYKYVPKKK